MIHITDQFTGTVDERRRTIMPCRRVVWSQGAVTHAEKLLDPSGDCCVLTNTPDAQASIVLDFGTELNGGVAIETGYPAPTNSARIRLRFGESVAETFGTPNNDHGIHDWTVTLPAICLQEIGLTGFRFVRIDLVDPESRLEIRSVKAVSLEQSWEQLGMFECSDARINAIWQAGTRTTLLCAQNYILDGIKRDRMVWAGDLHPQVHVIHRVFGGQEIIRRTLDLLRDRTPADGWMNNIPSYSAWWLIAHRDWYEYEGDFEYLKQQQAAISHLAHRLATLVNSQGRLTWEGRPQLDWATAHDPVAVDAGLQAVGLLGLEAAANLLDRLDDSALAAQCAAAVDRMRGAATPTTDNKQIAALHVLTGQLDPASANARVLSMDPMKDVGPWFGYYVLQARALAGDMTGSLQLLRDYWGAMLDLGATTFWEHFDRDWIKIGGRIDELPSADQPNIHSDCGAYCFTGLRHSLCHGWSAGPTAFLSEAVLGVRPIQPGYRQVAITPALGDLTWARGSVPTPQGIIRVEHRREPGQGIVSKWSLPPGVELAAAQGETISADSIVA